MDNPRKLESPDTFSPKGKPPEAAAPELENTGERFLPGVVGSAEVAYDHIARYRFAERYVKGKKTIDLGCGAGYGTYALSGLAESILGVDLSEAAVAYALWSYQAPNLRYEVGDVTDLSYEDGSFEAAVSFEVIEHLERPEALVEEARRLLKEDALFVVSTPDKQTYSNGRNYANLHHSKEMYSLEFRELLERHFRHVQIYRQGALAGNIIMPDPRELPEDGRTTLESTRFSLPEPQFDREVPTTLYMLAVCTNGRAPDPLWRPYVIMDCDRQVYEEYTDILRNLGLVLAYHQRSQQRVKHLQERVQQSQEHVRQLQEHVRQLLADRERSQQQVKHLQERVRRLQLSIQNMQNSRTWRITERLNGFKVGVNRILGR